MKRRPKDLTDKETIVTLDALYRCELGQGA